MATFSVLPKKVDFIFHTEEVYFEQGKAWPFSLWISILHVNGTSPKPLKGGRSNQGLLCIVFFYFMSVCMVRYQDQNPTGTDDEH